MPSVTQAHPTPTYYNISDAISTKNIFFSLPISRPLSWMPKVVPQKDKQLTKTVVVCYLSLHNPFYFEVYHIIS